MADSIPKDLKQRIKASYDAIAPKYNAWTSKTPTHRLVYLDKLLKLLRPAGTDGAISVLELGCGCGLPVTQKILQHADNVSVVANDLSSEQIRIAAENLLHDTSIPNVSSRLQLIEGDMTTLSFPDASLDAVVAMYSLIHLPLPEQAGMLEKIGRWLRPGGLLLANFSETAEDAKVMEGWLDEKGWAFWSGFGVDGTLERIRKTGLEVLIGEVAQDIVHERFLWVLGRKEL